MATSTKSTELDLQQTFYEAIHRRQAEAALDEIDRRKLTREDLVEILDVTPVAVWRALKLWKTKPVGDFGLIERSSLLDRLLTYLGCACRDSVCLPVEKALAGFESAMRENRRVRKAGYEPSWPLTLYPLTTLYVARRLKQMGAETPDLDDIKDWVSSCVATVRAECAHFQAIRKTAPWYVKSDEENRRDVLQHVGPGIGSLEQYVEFCNDWMPDFEAVVSTVEGLDIYFPRLGWAQHPVMPIVPKPFNTSRVVADAGVWFCRDAGIL